MKRVLVCLLIVALCLSAALLTACDSLGGKYTTYVDGVSSTYEFSGDNVKIYRAGVKIADGSYSIEGNILTYTYTLAGEMITQKKAFVQDGDTLEIDGVIYVKE